MFILRLRKAIWRASLLSHILNCSPMSLSRWLAPASTLDEQHAAACKELERRLAEDGPLKPPLLRPVGRPPAPKRSRDSVASADEADEPAKQKQKRSYSHWLRSDLFPHIVDAYKRNGYSARAALRSLQLSATLNVNGAFDKLNHSTIHSWFDPHTHKLTQRVQQLRSNAESYSRIGVAGRPRVLDDFPALEEEMKKELLVLRAGGVPMHLAIVRSIVAPMFARHAVGERLKLSKRWLQRWIENTMDWSWRAATSSARKLPDGWQQSGTLLAKRVAVDMHEYSIHESLVINADQTECSYAQVHHIPMSSVAQSASLWRATKTSGRSLASSRPRSLANFFLCNSYSRERPTRAILQLPQITSPCSRECM